MENTFDLIKAIEIFALVTGIPYMVLEVMQKKTMWYFGLATGAACAWSFGVQHLWASMGLNIYYVFMSLWGLYRWRRDEQRLREERDKGLTDATIHLARLDRRTLLTTVAVFIAGTALLIGLLHLLHDSESSMDATVTVMSALAMWWLGKAHPQHWLIWIVADTLLTVLCLSKGMYWMAGLYLFYTVAAVYGYFHWRRNGAYIDMNGTEKA